MVGFNTNQQVIDVIPVTGADSINGIVLAATAAFGVVHDRIEAEAADGEIPHERAMAIVDEVLEFLHGGVERLWAQ